MVDPGPMLNSLLIAGLMGVVGQGARAAVGLRGAGRLSGSPDQQTAFSAAYFALSLMIGFIAGVLAGFAVDLRNVADENYVKVLLGIAASGYAGADFIENSLSIFIPSSGASTPQAPPAPRPPANVPELADLSTHALALTNAVQQLTAISQHVAAIPAPAVITGTVRRSGRPSAA